MVRTYEICPCCGFELVLRASTDSHPSIRHAAARLLGDLDAPDALPQLLRMLMDSEASVRLSAATAFHRFGPAAAEHLHALEEALARETDKGVHDELRRVIQNLKRIA